MIEAVAMPRGARTVGLDQPAVQLWFPDRSAGASRAAVPVTGLAVLTLAEAADLHAKLGAALNTFTTGRELSA